MAITQSVSFVLPIVGDGVSTTMDIDLYNYIAEKNVLPKTPSVVQWVGLDAGGPAVTATLSGSVIHLSFASALGTVPAYNLTIQLGF